MDPAAPQHKVGSPNAIFLLSGRLWRGVRWEVEGRGLREVTGLDLKGCSRISQRTGICQEGKKDVQV